MAIYSDPTYTHIPAWKKMGLKLKFAKEYPENTVTHANKEVEATKSKKRKSADTDDPSRLQSDIKEKPLKRPKKAKLKAAGSSRANGDSGSAPLKEDELQSPPAVAKTPNTTRKSVSFTPETKTQDGEGVKQLYKTWLNKQMALDPSFDPSSVSPALRLVEPTNTATDKPVTHLSSSDPVTATKSSGIAAKKSKKPKKEQKKKHSKPSRLTSPENSSPVEHPALTYLTTHHTSPSTWKFSKPNQNHILKHLFSFTHIPSSYDQALLSYIRGLQGAARSRTREQALAIRSEDADWLASEPSDSEKMDQETPTQCIARRKRDYDSALGRIKQQLKNIEDEREAREWEMSGGREEWEERIQKRRRAELVIWAVGEENDIAEQPVAFPTQNGPKDSKHTSHEPATIRSKGMGGVKEISNGGVAKGSAGKKVVFGEDEPNGVGTHKPSGASSGVQKMEHTNGVNGEQVRRKVRQRRKQRTGVPDDDTSSSESSSSSSSSNSEESEVEQEAPSRGGAWGGYFKAKELSSDSSSDTSSSDGSDSESEDSSEGSASS
ncbi:hypothetical protein ACLMJK_000439 [Lecanora helva]